MTEVFAARDFFSSSVREVFAQIRHDCGMCPFLAHEFMYMFIAVFGSLKLLCWLMVADLCDYDYVILM